MHTAWHTNTDSYASARGMHIYICELDPELEVHMFAYSSLQLLVLICIVLYMDVFFKL